MFSRGRASWTFLAAAATTIMFFTTTVSLSRAFTTVAARSSALVAQQRKASVLAFAPSTTSFAFSRNDHSRRTTTSKNHQVLKMSSTSDKAELLCVHVFVTCKPGTEDAFKEASLANARESAKEEGIARFDVIQQIDDPTKFVLIEVYKNGDAPAAHKETAHYNTWRETVADMMAEPRSAIKYKNHFPATGAGWDYGDSALE